MLNQFVLFDESHAKTRFRADYVLLTKIDHLLKDDMSTVFGFE